MNSRDANETGNHPRRSRKKKYRDPSWCLIYFDDSLKAQISKQTPRFFDENLELTQSDEIEAPVLSEPTLLHATSW